MTELNEATLPPGGGRFQGLTPRRFFPATGFSATATSQRILVTREGRPHREIELALTLQSFLFLPRLTEALIPTVLGPRSVHRLPACGLAAGVERTDAGWEQRFELYDLESGARLARARFEPDLLPGHLKAVRTHAALPPPPKPKGEPLAPEAPMVPCSTSVLARNVFDAEVRAYQRAKRKYQRALLLYEGSSAYLQWKQAVDARPSPDEASAPEVLLLKPGPIQIELAAVIASTVENEAHLSISLLARIEPDPVDLASKAEQARSLFGGNVQLEVIRRGGWEVILGRQGPRPKMLEGSCRTTLDCRVPLVALEKGS